VEQPSFIVCKHETAVTKGFGIEKLKQETSINGSAGITYNNIKFSRQQLMDIY
jgi:hypothetical protein